MEGRADGVDARSRPPHPPRRECACSLCAELEVAVKALCLWPSPWPYGPKERQLWAGECHAVCRPCDLVLLCAFHTSSLSSLQALVGLVQPWGEQQLRGQWIVESSVDTVLERTFAATSLSGPAVHGRALRSPGHLWPPALAMWAPALLCPSPVGLLTQAGVPSHRVRPHVPGCRR